MSSFGKSFTKTCPESLAVMMACYFIKAVAVSCCFIPELCKFWSGYVDWYVCSLVECAVLAYKSFTEGLRFALRLVCFAAD